MSSAVDQLKSFLSTISGTPEGPPDYSYLHPTENRPAYTKTHFTMDFSVNYAGLAVPTVEYTHEDHARLVPASQLLLWPLQSRYHCFQSLYRQLENTVVVVMEMSW